MAKDTKGSDSMSVISEHRGSKMLPDNLKAGQGSPHISLSVSNDFSGSLGKVYSLQPQPL